MRQLVVAGQLALCIVLLVGSALLLRSFARVQAQPIGFDPDRLLTAELRLPATRYGNDTVVAQFADQALERLRALPGVRAAALLRIGAAQRQLGHDELSARRAPRPPTAPCRPPSTTR